MLYFILLLTFISFNAFHSDYDMFDAYKFRFDFKIQFDYLIPSVEDYLNNISKYLL